MPGASIEAGWCGDVLRSEAPPRQGPKNLCYLRIDVSYSPRPGRSNRPRLASNLLKTQSKRNADHELSQRAHVRTGILKIGQRHVLPDELPKWLCNPKVRLGLEYLFLLGHPERRYEIWDNRAPCVIAFSSEEEARLRFTHVAEDICRWEEVPLPKSSADCDMVEAGRFQLMRRDHRIHLEVAVDGRRRELLQYWTNKEAWDWG